MRSRLFALVRTLVIAPVFMALWLWLIPRLIGGPHVFDAPWPLGWIVGAIGAAIGLPCVWEFAWRGAGTPAPFDPPRKLVVTGPYRYVRNPMYVGLYIVFLGFAITFPHGRMIFLAELVFAFAAASLFVIKFEEPALRRLFGDDYADYCRHVGRWIPRLSPWYAAAHLD